MTMTPHQLQNARRARRMLAGAGLVLTGASLAAIAAAWLPGAPQAQARTPNFVRSAYPDAISRILLDEDVIIEFNTAVLGSSVGPDTVLIRTGINNGEQARGRYVVGSFLYDRAVQRRVVVRPEAVQEYYEMVKGQAREDAARSASNLLRRVESTGQISLLKTIDTQLRVKFGRNAGTRLDDVGVSPTDGVYATYPPQLVDTTPTDNDDPLTLDAGDDPREPYRTRIAGDDALWQAYLGGDVNAYAQLSENSEYERFYHAIDGATGVPSATSVLRQREYRRVLINRTNAARVMFVPEIPIRSDLADTGYSPARSYSIIVPASSPGVFNTVLTRDRAHPLQQTDGHDFSTLFTTVPATSSQLFRAAETYTGVSLLQTPRIINTTPPNGELYVDPTTDWEDPDNQFTVAVAQRKTFSVRMRFAQPLDPRTISPTTFTITKVASLDSAGNDVAGVNVPIAVGTFLNQHRLGIVEVEITPATNLDPQSRYSVVARSLVHSLAGAANPTDYVGTFTVGAGVPPIRAVQEDFTTVTNRADPTIQDTFGQITTAYWPAPALYDTTSSGKLAAAFMQFAGTGVGAPSNPQDPSSPINPAHDLNLAAGQQITFVTENVNPADPLTLGTPIEYNYTDFSMSNASASAVGRFPLVIRSQKRIVLASSQLLLAGLPGGNGKTNAGAIGDPTGGLGGSPGPAGFRGGDGGCAPMTDATGSVVLDGGGNLQFDQAKFNGQDGEPSYLAGVIKNIGTFQYQSLGGAGSGGFSGDAEAANSVDCFLDPNAPGKTYKDMACTPGRFRECGGGGGHATAGGDGDGARGSGKTKTGGYYGGIGGTAYGKADFSDQQMNNLNGTFGAPRLTFGSGGAGGGGGGAEDNTIANPPASASTAPDGLANAADGGGGGGGGGGGALQLVARTQILIDSSVISCVGGAGGRTFNAAQSTYGRGAPGGCGAGGAIWLQCYGAIDIVNGSTVTAAGGDNSQSSGFYQVNQSNPPIDKQGFGGMGGDGYVRFEDADGAANINSSTVKGSVTQAPFVPFDNPSTTTTEADFQAFPGKPFVVNFSQGFSRWFNAGLDTPTFAPHDDDPSTIAVDGTSVYAPNGALVQIWVRSAPNDTTNTGHPNLFLATSSGNKSPWTAYVDVGTVSRRRFLQFRVDFTTPLSYDFDLANLPYVDFVQIDINLN
jgi:hypothetical protein